MSLPVHQGASAGPKSWLRWIRMLLRRSPVRAVLLLCGLALALLAAADLARSSWAAEPNGILGDESAQLDKFRAADSSKFRPSRKFSTGSKITATDFEEIQSSLPKETNGSSRCTPPDLQLYSRFIRDRRPAVIPADLCSKRGSPNWLRVSQSRVQLLSQFAAANCSAEPVLRLDDHTSKFGSAQPIRNGSELPSLGFRASCRSPDGTKHSSVYYGTRRLRDSQLPPLRPGDAKRDSIIILGLDSLSRLESLRSLVNASSLLRTQLGALSLLQYNILGDGTPAALVPILTGTRESDMPEARRGFKGARHLDEVMQFIFHKLKELGYLTLYGEEGSSFGTFQLRFLGFKNEPADFYLRPVLQKQEALQSHHICIGNEVAPARMLTAIKDMFSMYPDRPKFAFSFFSSLSHESKDLTPMDAELTDFLKWFVSENLISNTTLILMSDHGQRLGPLRNSMQGKLEESLPLMTVALSRQLEARLPRARQTLATNRNRLTIPTDIHRTLLSIAGSDATAAAAADKFRSYSLIDEEVPETRGCSDAGIPAHWCSCLSSEKMQHPESEQLPVRAAQFAVAQMNLATAGFRNACAELRLDSIGEADVTRASNDLAQRKRGIEGRFALTTTDLSVRASGYVTSRFRTSPNEGQYEATVQFTLTRKGSEFHLNFEQLGESSRINKYGSQADCVVTRAPHLRKFCYCLTNQL
ncbi:hypothetical protein BOX15_Mlig015423g1 [Macrostomum lignano]|uniref:DUF229 domain-containing protein n=1 Tax=Macrostomum lignano TaxID=282301 RepID=A0A267FCD2_9PLAT|nr:hypothetical protein BOX15_Mlig015423g1 [Macrostomum lignano]